jgi:hypothetical protein
MPVALERSLWPLAPAPERPKPAKNGRSHRVEVTVSYQTTQFRDRPELALAVAINICQFPPSMRKQEYERSNRKTPREGRHR